MRSILKVYDRPLTRCGGASASRAMLEPKGREPTQPIPAIGEERGAWLYHVANETLQIRGADIRDGAEVHYLLIDGLSRNRDDRYSRCLAVLEAQHPLETQSFDSVILARDLPRCYESRPERRACLVEDAPHEVRCSSKHPRSLREMCHDSVTRRWADRSLGLVLRKARQYASSEKNLGSLKAVARVINDHWPA